MSSLSSRNTGTTVEQIRRHVYGLTLSRLIKGQRPGSIIEVYSANTFDKMGLEYFYQYTTYSVNKVLGVVKLDFLIKTPVKWLPVFTDGAEWHSRVAQKNEDFRKRAILDYVNRTRWWPSLSVPEAALPNQDASDAYYKKKLAEYGV